MYKIKAKQYNKWDRIPEARAAFDHFGIKFVDRNRGIHWQFTHDKVEYNYFPTTGRWFTVEPKHSCGDNERFLSGLLRTLGFEFEEVN